VSAHGWIGRWFDPNWYRYLRGRHPGTALALGAAAVAALLGAGVAVGVGYPRGGSSHTYVALETTVMQRQKVRQPSGKIVIRRVPVVKRIFAEPVTVLRTSTVRTPGGTQVVTEPVVRYRQVVRRQVVTVDGKVRTVVRPVTNTQMLTDTQLLTVTNERVETATVVQNRTQTTVQVRTDTQVRTETETHTLTQPAETVTVTRTVTDPTTVVVTDTITVPVTVTVTLPSGP